jgi:phosphatidylglycerophosphate synthase
MSGKPWDQRLAAFLVRPLARTAVHPNHITALGLLLGLASASAYASGASALANLGGALFMLAMLTDHADGELARASGKTSRFGHAFDRIVAGVNHTVIFIGIGIGQVQGFLGSFSAILGLIAGLSIASTFAVRAGLERRAGAGAIAQPSLGGFEVEDVMYLLGPITWLGLQSVLLLAAAIGAPAFLAASLMVSRRVKGADSATGRHELRG